METSESVNTLEVFIIMIAAIILLLWLIWVIRLAVCKGRLTRKNRLLLKQQNELMLGHRKILRYEDLLESAPGLLNEEPQEMREIKRTANKLENQVRQSKIFLNQKVSKEELATLVGMDKKSFDAFSKENFKEQTSSQWLDLFRIEYAMDKLRALKVELGRKVRNSSDNGESSQNGQIRPDKEKRLERIANESGFSGRKTMDKAFRFHIGMSLNELMKILKAQK